MHTLYREFTEQAQIDAQYNASLQCANVAAEMRHYVEASQRAREHLPCTLDLHYGPTLAETLDVFPAAKSLAPVLVFLHGGYWRALSSQDFSCVALGLHKLGITTVVVNYALCPRVSINEIVRQARAAVAWVLRTSQPTAVTRAGWRWAVIRPARTWRRCASKPPGRKTTACRKTRSRRRCW